MKKNGFISTSLIYAFFVLFVLLMIYLMNSYSSTRFFMQQYKYDIKSDFAEASIADINLYFMVWDPTTNEYEIQNEMPTYGYKFDDSLSYCKRKSTIAYVDGNISVAASRRDECYAYFKQLEPDIQLKIYTKETTDSERVFVDTIPGFEFAYSGYECTNGATIDFNEETRKIKINTKNTTTCEIEFVRRQADIKIIIYKENVMGSHEYDGVMYEQIDSVPGSAYTFKEAVCGKETIITAGSNNELKVSASAADECNVYFEGGYDKVNLIIMKESDEGVKGYTTGKKYVETPSSPGEGYKYVGYICDDNNGNIVNDGSATVSYNNGTLTAVSDKQVICRAYFNKYSGNVYIHYYLEKGIDKEEYENVSSIPSLGYIYNKTKSYCDKGSTIAVNNNIVSISATEDDECYVYFDMITADIEVLVYVMNRETKLYELSKVPVSGYTLSSASCTNGASIDYVNSSLVVNTEGPTVCEVYFY